MNDTDTIEYNIKVHDKLAKKYEKIHIEIYNEEEQNRLRESLVIAKNYISTNEQIPKVLDFGCGAGNLTKHLTEIGCDVVASDVSQGFLDLVSSKTFSRKIETAKLNGKDLSNFPNDYFDMVCMYSVLHHVPDYLSLMKEFMRVLKKGGVLYIDHEASENIWLGDDSFKKAMNELKKTSVGGFGKYLYLNNYVDFFIRKFINKKFQREGDIHVWADDHIVWKDVNEEIKKSGGIVVLEEDYLLFRKGYNLDIYKKYKNKHTDTHLLIAKRQ